MTGRRPIAAAFMLLLISGCMEAQEYPSRPITLTCPWAAGGGTDRVSRQIAIYLEQELQVPVNVINATGGQGVTGHARGLLASADGYTLAMMTLELNTMHWRGLTNLDWQDCEPLMSLNEDAAAIFVRSDAPWDSISELQAAVVAEPGRLTASGTASLGAWHLALAGWLMSFDRDPGDIIWIPSQGSAPSLQELMSGGVQVVCCSVPEARALLEAGHIRCLGIMSDERITQPGLDRLPTMREQGVAWALKGWRGLGVPRGTPPVVQQRLVSALRKIVGGETQVSGQTFPAYMDGEGFDRTFRETDAFAAFMQETDASLGKLLMRDDFQEVHSGPVGPLAFPILAACLGGCSLLASVLLRETDESTALETGGVAGASTTWSTMAVFMAVPLLTAGYGLAAGTAGFIPVAFGILLVLSLLLRAPLHVALLLAACGSVALYQIFTGLLRVTLPIGWLGW